MNGSAILLLLCAFALSEVLLAKKAHVNGFGGMKASHKMRFVRSSGCPTDAQCYQECTFNGAEGGKAADAAEEYYCKCIGGENAIAQTEERCSKSCEMIGVGGGQLDGEGMCDCNDKTC